MLRLLLSLVLIATAVLTAPANADERPNIVWLIAEDSSKHYYQLFDQHGVATPNIERLASTGITFENAFSNSPVCSVARTTLITGCYAPRLGTQFHRKTKPVKLPPGIEMFPALLRKAGYYTTNNAKKDYNAVEASGVWDQSSRRATWRNRDAGQPFFHCQTFTASHEGSLHFDRNAMAKQKTANDPNEVFVPPYLPDTKLFRYTTARYLDRVQKVDQLVGDVVQQLTEDGLMDSTFVFFFGDHGGVLPRSKGYLYETGLHVPLVVHVPEKFSDLVSLKIKRGERSSDFVSFVDFAPTVLQLASIVPGDQLDGKPFLRMDPFETNIAFGYADRFDEKIDLVRSVRTSRYKYIRNFQSHYPDALQNNYRYRMLAYQQWRQFYRDGRLNTVQSQFFQPKPVEMLFDIQKDPNETKNLASDPTQKRVMNAMRNDLRKWMVNMPDTGLFPEHILVDQALESPLVFGKRNKTKIEGYLNIANLALGTTKDAHYDFRSALESKDPWQRYWALQSMSAIGEIPKLKNQFEWIRSIAANDAEPLNRVAAAEFLAIHSKDDLQPVLDSVIKISKNKTELASVLNSAVLLRDHYRRQVKIDRESFPDFKPKSKENVARRLRYLLGEQ